MIAKAKSCPGGTALFQYVLNENKGYELSRNGLSGLTPKELNMNMSIIQQQNLRCTNNTISIVLSPSIEDGKKISYEKLKMLMDDFFKYMDLDPKSNQYITFIHTEKDHLHAHCILNRVLMDGSLINDRFISKNAQEAAHRVALKHSLVSAREIKESREQENKNKNLEVKKAIRDIHFKVLKTKPDTLEAYIARMLEQKIEVLPTINKQGKIQGFRYIHQPTGVNLKASEVDRKLKLNQLFTNSNTEKSKEITTNLSYSDWKLNLDFLDTFSDILNSIQGDDHYDDFDENMKRRNRRRRRRL